MLEKVDETLNILVSNNAPSDIVDKVRDTRNTVRYQPAVNPTYDMVEMLRRYRETHVWAKKALEVWTGRISEYDSSRK